MTVYSINKRALEQSTTTAPIANTAKSGEDSVAEFTSALQQATSSLFGGASRTPSAENALKGHFERETQQATQPKAADKPERADAKPVARSRGRDDDKSGDRNDKVKAPKADDKAGKVESKQDDTAADKDDKVETVVAEDDVTVATDADTAAQTVTVAEQNVQPQAVAAVIQAPQEQVQQVETETVDVAVAAEATVQAETVQTPAQQKAATQQAQAADDAAEGDAGAEADDGDAAELLTADTTQAATPAQAHKNAAKAKADDVVQAQSDDLAQRLNDTGAQIKVQVQVSNTAQTQAQTDSAAADVLVTQEVAAAPVLPVQDGTNAGQTDSQDAGLAATAQPGAAQGNTQQNAAAQTKPFDAILAAQVEATTGAQADAPAGQTQNTQPVAGLNGVGGTAAAQKAQAPQAAQAPRPFQLPPGQEVMDQVSVQIAKHAKDGGDTIKVQLKPVELGAIEIKLDVAKDGTVTTVVTADNQDTLDLLKKDQSSLQKALEDAGLKSDTGSMTFNLREGNQQQANQQNTGSGTGRRRARLEAAAAADAASAKAAAAAQARWGMSRSGVDIQV